MTNPADVTLVIKTPFYEMILCIASGGTVWGGGASVRPPRKAGGMYRVCSVGPEGERVVDYFASPANAVGAYIVAVGGNVAVTLSPAVVCVNCGSKSNLSPAFVGYEDQTLCVTCESESDRG